MFWTGHISSRAGCKTTVSTSCSDNFLSSPCIEMEIKFEFNSTRNSVRVRLIPGPLAYTIVNLKKVSKVLKCCKKQIGNCVSVAKPEIVLQRKLCLFHHLPYVPVGICLPVHQFLLHGSACLSDQSCGFCLMWKCPPPWDDCVRIRIVYVQYIYISADFWLVEMRDGVLNVFTAWVHEIACHCCLFCRLSIVYHWESISAFSLLYLCTQSFSAQMLVSVDYVRLQVYPSAANTYQCFWICPAISVYPCESVSVLLIRQAHAPCVSVHTNRSVHYSSCALHAPSVYLCKVCKGSWFYELHATSQLVPNACKCWWFIIAASTKWG